MPQVNTIRVLLVEDEVMTTEMICDYIQEIGFQLLVPVSTGEAAIYFALKDKPDIILMDIGLAGNMNGIETAKAIQQKLPIPIIFISGYDYQDIQNQTSALQPSAFISKPLIMERLKSLMFSMLKLEK